MNTRKKVLLVDDDADFVEMNRAVLEKNGYEVITACNGRECVEKARAEKPDLVVLDVMMATDTEGFDVARNLQHYSRDTKNIPIIMITSVGEKYPFNFEPDEWWLPVQVFIEKPITPEHLLREVRKQLGEETRTGQHHVGSDL